VGVLGVAASALPVRRNRIGRREERVFRALNRLPDRLHRPAWVVMQLGSLGAAPALAGLAWVAGERRLAARLAVSGLSAWTLAKLVKQVIRRGRPSTVIAGVRHRGPESSGLGYLSGHAAVSTALVLAGLPHLGRRIRWPALMAAPLVGLSRIFVGAHLPLDVVGGASLGILVDGAARRLLDRPGPEDPSPQAR
jgi:undecaprenyl-diphosphatase